MACVTSKPPNKVCALQLEMRFISTTDTAEIYSVSHDLAVCWFQFKKIKTCSMSTKQVYNPAALVCSSQIPSAEQLMFMRPIGWATIKFDPHFASSQISPQLPCSSVQPFIRWLWSFPVKQRCPQQPQLFVTDLHNDTLQKWTLLRREQVCCRTACSICSTKNFCVWDKTLVKLWTSSASSLN